jgi:hypothetical protein
LGWFKFEPTGVCRRAVLPVRDQIEDVVLHGVERVKVSD